MNLNLHGAARGVAAARVVDAANVALVEVFGNDIGEHIVARSFVKNEVVVAFTDPMAASEVRNRQADILSRIRQRLPGTKISGLRTVPATDRPL